MSTIQFSVQGESLTPTKLEAKARQFSFLIDEPPALGGKDEGANPVEYLLGSYAGCLNVVFHLVAKEQNVNVHSLSIKVTGDIDPSKLFGKANFNRAGFQSINVELDVDSDADEATLNKLIDTVKGRCPVNDNLSNVTQLNYRLLSKTVAV